MFEKKKTLSLAEAERALWSTKGVFPSCLALKMEKPSNWCVSLTLGRLTQRRHRRGFGWEEGDSVGPVRSGPERQGDRLIECLVL